MEARILARVRKLLAVSTSTNVHEAAVAAEQAQRLIARHRLEGWLTATEATTEPIVDARDTPLESTKRLRKWKVVLAGCLADANDCAVYTLARGRESALVLVGRQRDQDAVHALWDGLVRRIEWLSASAGPGQPRQWHDSFRIGAAEIIGQRLRQVSAPPPADLDQGALVRLDQALEAHRSELDRFVREELNLGRGRRIRVWTEAYDQGREAGSTLPLPETD